MKKTIIIAIPLLAALLWGATSGNIQWTQLASLSRHGTATKGQSSDGTGTSGNCAQFDASGNLVDAGAACGTSSTGNATTVNGAAVPASSLVSGTNSSRQLIAATAANIVSLFSGCSGTQYLGADGACHTPSTGSGGFSPIGTATCSGGAVCTTGVGSAVVTTAGTTVTFSSIPGTANTLQLVVCARSSRSANTDGVLVEMNGDGAANYNQQFFNAQNTTLGGALTNGTTPVAASVAAANATTSRPGCFISEIPAYTGTTFDKIFNTHGSYDSGTSGLQLFTISLIWLNTSAITSVVATPSVGPNWAVGSSFFLNGY